MKRLLVLLATALAVAFIGPPVHVCQHGHHPHVECHDRR